MRTHLRAWLLGFRDGWRQPHELVWSRNIEHLPGYNWRVQESQDKGINLGQRLRSPFKHQRF
jgi:hypothetical protein